MPVYQFGIYKNEDWNEDTHEETLWAGLTHPYRTGFHLYKTKKGAQAVVDSRFYPVAKVEYDDVVATGRQDDQTVIVARKFRFLE